MSDCCVDSASDLPCGVFGLAAGSSVNQQTIYVIPNSITATLQVTKGHESTVLFIINCYELLFHTLLISISLYCVCVTSFDLGYLPYTVVVCSCIGTLGMYLLVMYDTVANYLSSYLLLFQPYLDSSKLVSMIVHLIYVQVIWRFNNCQQ